MSAAAEPRRHSAKLGQMVNFPFAASLVLNDDHAEVQLYIFLGANSTMPQTAISVAMRYPYQPLLADAKKPRFKIEASAKDAHHERFLDNFDLIAAATKLADAHLQVSSPVAISSDVPEASAPAPEAAAVAKPVEFLTLASTFDANKDDETAAMAILDEANAGVVLHAPQLVAEGEGGTYFVHDASGATIGVFKPTDEDPQADNNPKRKNSISEEEREQQRTRQSIPANETAVREAAAYAIDRGYAGVPPTFLVEARHASFGDGDQVKLGSLQQFVDNECASWDVGPAAFSVADVHRIGMFDIRTFNTDRHGGNLLCRPTVQPQGKVQYDLVPIDHAYCFPTALGEANWEWLYWPQAKVPFTEDELRYIDSIDVDADVALLARFGLSKEALRVYRTTTTFLKKGAAAGLTLFELGKLCYRGRNDAPSQLEAFCAAALPFDSEEADSVLLIAGALEKFCQSQCVATISATTASNNNNNQRTQASRG
jgi:hypothetical protein